MTCPRDDIHTVREARRLRLDVGEVEGEAAALVSTHEIGRFRAVRVPAQVKDEVAIIAPRAAEALRVRRGEAVRVKT